MSRYFGFVNGEVHDYRYKKHPQGEGWYLFCLGKHEICTLIKSSFGYGGWTVIVSGSLPIETKRSVKGFVNRHAAIDYALAVHELTKKTYGRT